MSNIKVKSQNDNDYEFINKKQKIDHNSMVDGSIIKIVLKNFMTFNEIKYNPLTKLNLIIGPNGSGKSSIVTALILGFGGSPKDINRGDKVNQFVKRGEKIADINIELYKKSDSNVHLRRTIFATNEACKYYVNHILVTKKKYISVVESLNIKVHNLCQFLPQDRLEDFSKLDSKGLLLNALQSVENQDLIDNFEKLKVLANSKTSNDANKKKIEEMIKIEIASNLKLETIVSSFTEKNLLQKQLLVVFQKKYWSLYILCWQDIKNEINMFDNAKKHNHKALKLINHQRNTIAKKNEMENNLKKVVLQNARVVRKILDNIILKVDDAKSHVFEMKELNKTIKNNLRKIEDINASISSMEEKLENIKNEQLNIEEYQLELTEINKNILKIDQNINPMRSNLEIVKNKLKGLTEKIYAIDQKLEREKQKEDCKNDLLQRKFPEMWKAVKWLRNCDKNSFFQGQVFEPLFTQIELIDQRNAKYIENIVSNRDMIAFVFEYTDDLTKFSKIIKQEQWKKINFVCAPSNNIKINETSNYNISDLKKFGFYNYALDIIKTPHLIRRFLIQNYKLQNIPIGSKDVMNNINNLPDDIKFFFAGDNQVIKNTSLYTGEKIIRQSQISNDAYLLLFSVDSDLIQSLTMKKNDAKTDCTNAETQLTESMNKLKVTEDSRQPLLSRKKEIQGNFIKYENKKNAYEKMIKDIEFIKNQLKREKEKSTTFINQYMQLINKYLNSMEGANNMMDNYATNLKTFTASAFIIKNCDVDSYEEYKTLKQLRTLYTININNFNEYNLYIQKLESEFKKILEIALRWSRGISPYDKKLFQPLKESFDDIEENDIEDLDALIIEKKTKLNCLNIDQDAPQKIEEYKQRKLKIKDLENKLKIVNNNVQSAEEQIENLHVRWFSELKNLVDLLNTNFSKFLNTFGCNGLIELDTGLLRYDYQAYGLLIKVQFRNENPTMRLLDAKSQSGGERALTTALFLLALQEVTHFPFRIVDEINQGMDKVYERKLMELFMSLFDKRNNQYFVITPKLIPNLSFKNTMVEIIFKNNKDKE